MASHLRLLHESGLTEAMECDLAHSILFQTDDKVSMADVEAAFLFGSAPGLFKVHYWGKNSYQVIGSKDWKQSVLEQGKIWIRGRAFEISTRYHEVDCRAPTKRFWIRVLGVPYGWRSLEGMKEVINFGQIVTADPNTRYMRDLRWVRVEVEVEDRSLIPESVWFEIKYRSKNPELCEVLFVVEKEAGGRPEVARCRSLPLVPWGAAEEAFFKNLPSIPPFENFPAPKEFLKPLSFQPFPGSAPISEVVFKGGLGAPSQPVAKGGQVPGSFVLPSDGSIAKKKPNKKKKGKKKRTPVAQSTPADQPVPTPANQPIPTPAIQPILVAQPSPMI